jgi:fatty acid desaturase
MTAAAILAFMSGNLCYQIEHHLYPDLPSNRYPEIAEQVRALCVAYDLPYTTGPLLRQYLLTARTICKLALPDRFLFATSDDAPETASGQIPESSETIALLRYRARCAATRIGHSDTRRQARSR